MKQLSIVSLYGPKPDELECLIQECQKILLAGATNVVFHPYEEIQIHATLIGLEHLQATRFNLNFARYRDQHREMDFEGVIEFIRSVDYIPLVVQLGGFQESFSRFRSRGELPFSRSFLFTGDKAVMMGWPIDNPVKEPGIRYPDTLEEFRKAFQDFNILHSYHRDPGDRDNDFYFRIGMLDLDFTDRTEAARMEKEIREYLQSIPPLFLRLDLENIFLACYEDNQLTPSTTRVWKFSDGIISARFMWSLLT